MMKLSNIFFVLLLIFHVSTESANAQVKEGIQLSSLAPTLLVVYSDIEDYHKTHYLLSTIGYMGAYMVFDSKWKSVLLTLLLGGTKELVYDRLLGYGEPLWSDMKWNTLGVMQGVTFTFSLDF